MTLIGTNLVAQLAMINFKNEMVKSFAQKESLTKKENADYAYANMLQMFMMAYLWPCCLKGEKFKKIK